MKRSVLIVLVLFAGGALSQQAEDGGRRPARPAVNPNGPWFGTTLPPRFEADPAVVVGNRTTRPVTLPPGSPADADLESARIRKDLERIVGFSKASRASKEIGSGQLWGRISGFPSSAQAIDWAIQQLTAAGIKEVHSQPIAQEARASLWLPESWEVRLLGDADLGAGSSDVVLESAMPLSPSIIPGGSLTAPLVFVGGANPSLQDRIDVKGKIAVQVVVPQGHMVFERGTVTPRAQALLKRGAVAVLNLVRLPGNERSLDFSGCSGPCFNIGGRDSAFLEAVLDRAAERKLEDKVRAQLTLKSGTHSNLQAKNGVGIVRGKSDEVIIIDAHADAWFDGAGDNADGLAVTLALARHFAKPQNKPERTLVFVISAGHHTSGLNGPRNFVNANPELVKKTVLAINVEHVAQRNFSAGRSTAEDGYRHFIADSGEAPITFGVTNGAPFIDELAQRGMNRYGVNFVSETSKMQSGETGGFGGINAAKITIMQAPPLYHTTGETLDVISTPGLERMARFLTFFVAEAAKAPNSRLNPP